MTGKPHLGDVRGPVYQQALEKAIAIKGGTNALAKLLRVSPNRVRAWRDGDDLIPGRVFLTLSELLTEYSVQELRKPRRRKDGG